MKKFRILIISAIAAMAFILSGCTTGPRVNGSPGINVSGDQVFVANQNFVYAFNTSTKNIDWQFPDEGSNKILFYSQPLVTNDSVYVGDLANNFYKINIENGNADWTFSDAKGFFIGLAAEEDGIVYAPSNDGNVYAIGSDGVEVWHFKTGHFIWAQPQISGDVVYIGSMDHFVYAVNKSTGEELWKHELGGAVVNSLLISEDGKTLFVGTLDKEMVALDTTTTDPEKRVKWSFNAEGTLGSVWGNAILVDNTLYFADTSGKIFALNANDGTEVWPSPIKFAGTIIGGLAALENGFVFATQEGDVQGYDFSGQSIPEWNFSVSGEVFQAPVVTDKYLAVSVLDKDYLFYLYDLGGNLVWDKPIEK